MPEPINGTQAEIKRLLISQAIIEESLKGVLKELEEAKKDREQLRKLLEDKYVTRERFDSVVSPMQKIIFGTTGAILLAFLSALIAIVLQAGGTP